MCYTLLSHDDLHCAALYCHVPYLHGLTRFNKWPSRTKLQMACEQGSLSLIECSLKKKYIYNIIKCTKMLLIKMCCLLVPYSTLSCCTYIVSYAIVTRCTYIVPYSTDTNNFVILFPHKEIHKLTWISPNQIDKKRIDHLLISGMWRRSLQDVRYRSGVDVGSSHHLVVAHNTLKLKRTVTPIRLLKWFNVSKLKDAGIRPVMQ